MRLFLVSPEYNVSVSEVIDYDIILKKSRILDAVYTVLKDRTERYNPGVLLHESSIQDYLA